MEKSNVKFAIQFIINFLVWNILLGIAGRLIAAALVTVFSIGGSNICYVVVFAQEFSILASVILSVFMTQKSSGKKGELTDDGIIRLYIALCLTLTIINIILSVLGFSIIYKMCEGNISITSLANNLVDSKGVPFDDALEQSKNLIYQTVKRAVIIANIFYSIILASLIPVFNNAHKSKV